jgi:hypothetical protein
MLARPVRSLDKLEVAALGSFSGSLWIYLLFWDWGGLLLIAVGSVVVFYGNWLWHEIDAQ